MAGVLFQGVVHLIRLTLEFHRLGVDFISYRTFRTPLEHLDYILVIF